MGLPCFTRNTFFSYTLSLFLILLTRSFLWSPFNNLVEKCVPRSIFSHVFIHICSTNCSFIVLISRHTHTHTYSHVHTHSRIHIRVKIVIEQHNTLLLSCPWSGRLVIHNIDIYLTWTPVSHYSIIHIICINGHRNICKLLGKIKINSILATIIIIHFN